MNRVGPGRKFGAASIAAALLVPAAIVIAAVPAHATDPGGNGVIVYQGDSCQLWKVSPDAPGTRTQLTNLSSCASDPAWSPNGSMLAFTTGSQLETVTANGTNPTVVLDGPANGMTSIAYPTWSPDGTRIAFVADGGDLKVVHADGTGLATVLAHGVTTSYAFPDWSPDGTTLAVEQDGGSGGSQIALVTLSNSSVQTITDGPNDSAPSWSPDGTQIAFERDYYLDPQGIYRVPATGGSPTQLSDQSDHDELPAWSPDGSRIAFGTTISGVDVWTMSAADGSNRISMTNGCDCRGGGRIAWQPVPAANTPTGSNVSVSGSGVTVTFSSVQTAGTTSVTSTTASSPPAGYTVGNPPISFDVSTTAVYTGSIEICVDITGVSFNGTPTLIHYVNGSPVVVPADASSTPTMLCGQVTSLSPFAVYGKAGSTVPSVSIADATVAEGDSGTTPMTFTVTLSGPSASPVTVNYATSNGTATAGSDYAATSGRLTIPAHATTGSITVPVKGDMTVENDETLALTLTNPQNATLGRSVATGTIMDDDTTTTSSPVHANGTGKVGTAKTKFGFNVASKNDKDKGHLDFIDETARKHLRSVSVTSVTCSGNRVSFSGTGKVKDALVSFQVVAVDGGAKGAGDTFSIHWPGYSAQGPVQGGDIRVRC